MKEFSGQVFTPGTFEKEFNFYVKNHNGNPHAMAFVAPPYEYDLTETRVVIADREPIAASIYRDHGKLIPAGETIPHQLGTKQLDLIKRITDIEWQPAPIYILDIAFGLGDNFVMEINAFNTASLYGCRLAPMFHAAGIIAQREFEELNEP